MVLMVLDHARDFFFGLTPSPTDLAHTSLDAKQPQGEVRFLLPLALGAVEPGGTLDAHRQGVDPAADRMDAGLLRQDRSSSKENGEDGAEAAHGRRITRVDGSPYME